MTGKKRILGILIAFLVAVSFAPITGQTAFADEEELQQEVSEQPQGVSEPSQDDSKQPQEVSEQPQNAFDVSGQVKGLAKASVQYNSVTIKWKAYAKAEGYQIYRANKKNGSYKKIATVTACTYKDKGNKTLGKDKYYKVRAFKTVDSVKQYTKFSSILAAKPSLKKPENLTVTSNSTCVKLTWTKVSGATRYQVYRAKSKTGKYTRIKTTKNKNFTNTSLTRGQKYYYKVRAYKKQGKKKKYGPFTGPVAGVTSPNVPCGFKTVLAKDGTVTCSWDNVTGANGYELQRATSANGSYVKVAETKAKSLKDSLTASGKYYYRVRAFVVAPNGKRLYGSFSSGGRNGAVNQARSWVGCKESNGSHKKIIDVYNNYGPKYGKINYSTSWCAAFVSAVAIKTGNTEVIPIDCYCPRMMDNFAKRTTNKSYTPQGGDVVFYDWNANKVPDHVGMIESVSGKDVTAIEGNCSDSVKRRTFKTGYSLLLSYGLPAYTVSNMVSYKAPAQPVEKAAAAASVSEEDIMLACEEIAAPEEPAEELAAEPAEEQIDETAAEAAEPEAEAFAEDAAAVETEPATDVEVAEKIVEYIQEETPAEDESAEERAFNAFLVYEVCDEMDIDACVVTITDEDGTERSYNEVVLDGELYILDATEEGGVLEEYTPEEIN